MSVHWYPGHMHKATRQIKESLSEIDIILEVMDARAPFSSENPAIESLRGDKPCVKILSKSDLADPDVTSQWLQYYDRLQLVKPLSVCSRQPEKIKGIATLCRELLPHKETSVKDIHAMIVGIPNVGKSTIINILAGKAVAKTGNEPAVTKGQQRINLRNGILLLDTPGILWPKVGNENSSYRLATTGAIKDTAMDYVDVAFFASRYLIKNYPDLLIERYQLDSIPASEIEFMELLGSKRGCLTSGGRVDLEKVSKILINEIRSGALGLISFETPSMIDEEQRQLENLRAKKMAKEAERKKRKPRKS